MHEQLRLRKEGLRRCVGCSEVKTLDLFYAKKCKNKRDKTILYDSFTSRCKICWQAYTKPSRKARYLKQQKRDHYLYTYGITLHELDTLLELQEGRCAICDKKIELVADHNHQTGLMRGLLCRRCNLGIGYFDDNPKLLEYAKIYLGG